MSRRTPREQPIRITTVAASRGQDIAVRQRRYLISMSFRVVCFVLAIVTGAALHWLWLALIFILIALVIPYLAVVAANAAHTKGEDMSLLDSPFGRQELRGGRDWRDEYGDQHR
jgi:hypothetical protein